RKVPRHPAWRIDMVVVLEPLPMDLHSIVLMFGALPAQVRLHAGLGPDGALEHDRYTEVVHCLVLNLTNDTVHGPRRHVHHAWIFLRRGWRRSVVLRVGGSSEADSDTSIAEPAWYLRLEAEGKVEDD